MKILKMLIVYLFLFNTCNAAGFFDFWGGGDTAQDQTINREADLDLNMDEVRQGFGSVNREKSIFELIPYLSYSYNNINIDYQDGIKRTDAISSEFGVGVSLNTGFDYILNTKFGYMFHFDYKKFNFDQDEGSTTYGNTKISGHLIKAIPIVFYEFKVDTVTAYAGFGYGLSKVSLSGTNNYSENVALNELALTSVYKLEIFYGRVMLILTEQDSDFSEEGNNIDLDELDINVGFLISF